MKHILIARFKSGEVAAFSPALSVLVTTVEREAASQRFEYSVLHCQSWHQRRGRSWQAPEVIPAQAGIQVHGKLEAVNASIQWVKKTVCEFRNIGHFNCGITRLM